MDFKQNQKINPVTERTLVVGIHKASARTTLALWMTTQKSGVS